MSKITSQKPHKKIPYSTQSIDDSDIQSVIEVLKSGWLTQGPCIQGFEDALRHYCGASYATAVSNGTAALHLACKALGLGEGDILWTTPNSFVASANCGLYCGAKVDFVDIDPRTRNLDPNLLEEKLKTAKNKLPKVLVAVHFAGLPCDMEKISKICRPLGIRVIEDASHALGSSYRSHKTGACQYSDLTVFSFHPVKNMTTGEGGAILTNQEKLHKKLQQLRSHGITRQAEDFTAQNQRADGWYYEQQDLGFNARITDLQCALGMSQLKRLDDFIGKRKQLFDTYQARLQHLPLQLPTEMSYAKAAWHLYAIEIKNGKNRSDVFFALKEAGIHVNVHYIPIHLQPYYARLGFRKGDFPNAEKYYDQALSLPLYPELPQDALEYVVEQLQIILNE